MVRNISSLSAPLQDDLDSSLPGLAVLKFNTASYYLDRYMAVKPTFWAYLLSFAFLLPQSPISCNGMSSSRQLLWSDIALVRHYVNKQFFFNAGVDLWLP